ncbi:MAG: prepilin-type N-terminal cleavage/methylation domain-containing protein [Pseudomonadota bacterium]
MNTSRTKNNRGFTLLETISVLVILGVLTAVALAAMSSSDTVQPVVEIQILKGHLRFAQAKAMSDVVAWGLEIQSGSYTLLRDWTDAAINLPGEDSNTHDLAGSLSLGGDLGIYTFDSRGIPSRNGSELTANASLSLDGAPSITITRETGFIP